MVVNNAGDGDGLDHANWANARLIGDQTGDQVYVNFQTAAATVPAGYLADAGLVSGDRGNGQSYGWSVSHADVARDREVNADQRLDTLNQFHAGATWELALPNGVYAVTTSIGDPSFTSTHTLNVEGISFWDNLTLNANQFRQRTLLVAVADGRLTLDQGSGPERGTRLNYIEVIPTATPVAFPLALGDFNADAQVDGSDFLQWQRGFGAPNASHSQGDGDEDGDVDRADLTVWQASFGTTHPATAASEDNNAVALVANLASSEEIRRPTPFKLETLGLPSLPRISNRQITTFPRLGQMRRTPHRDSLLARDDAFTCWSTSVAAAFQNDDDSLPASGELPSLVDEAMKSLHFPDFQSDLRQSHADALVSRFCV